MLRRRKPPFENAGLNRAESRQVEAHRVEIRPLERSNRVVSEIALAELTAGLLVREEVSRGGYEKIVFLAARAANTEKGSSQ